MTPVRQARLDDGDLPPDLLRVLRDQSVVIGQDAAVFDVIAQWAKTPSNTASAHLPKEPIVNADENTHRDETPCSIPVSEFDPVERIAEAISALHAGRKAPMSDRNVTALDRDIAQVAWNVLLAKGQIVQHGDWGFQTIFVMPLDDAHKKGSAS